MNLNKEKNIENKYYIALNFNLLKFKVWFNVSERYIKAPIN